MGNSTLIRNPIVNHARKVQAEDFHSIENIDVELNLKCGNCKCGRCLLGGKDFTSKKENSILLKRDWSEKQNIHHIISMNQRKCSSTSLKAGYQKT